MIDESAGPPFDVALGRRRVTTAHHGEFCSRLDETGGETLNGERNVP